MTAICSTQRRWALCSFFGCRLVATGVPVVTQNTLSCDSGDVQFCVTDIATQIDPDKAHEWTTTNASCRNSNPDSCWFLNIWDYMLTN